MSNEHRDLVSALADAAAKVWMLDPQLGEEWDGMTGAITSAIDAARLEGREAGLREGTRITPRLTLDPTFMDREKQRLLSTADRYWSHDSAVLARDVIHEWFSIFVGNLRNELASGRYGRAVDDSTDLLRLEDFEAADRLLMSADMVQARLALAQAGMVSIKSVMLSIGVKADDR